MIHNLFYVGRLFFADDLLSETSISGSNRPLFVRFFQKYFFIVFFNKRFDMVLLFSYLGFNLLVLHNCGSSPALRVTTPCRSWSVSQASAGFPAKGLTFTAFSPQRSCRRYRGQWFYFPPGDSVELFALVRSEDASCSLDSSVSPDSRRSNCASISASNFSWTA